MGITVSCDLNYRAKLWQYGKTAQEIMGEMIQYVDICIANEEDIQNSLGIRSEITFETGDLDISKYQHLAGILMEKYPNVKQIAITLRESKSANHNNWFACLFDGNEFLISTKYSIMDIVDRVGSGDSFSAGLIYGLNNYKKQERCS